MPEFVSDKKRIAKNTAYLYVRMILVTLITLYTSRVILQTLGASDFGIYNVVGGVVAMMAFVRGPLNGATVRFLTFELGRQDKKKLSDTFAACLNLHIFVGILAIIIGETIGLWFFYNKLNIPEDRMWVASWVYQFSIVNCFFDLTQISYKASINSHEKMSVYAYIGLYEAASKLLIVYLITVSPWDRLLFYGFLLMVNKIAVQLYCRYYCLRNYSECSFRLFWDKPLYKKLSGYAGWDTFGGVALVCEGQGVNILLNIFFGPVVNAARAIALQIRTAVTMFISNLTAAVRPQIVKNYAVGNVDEMYNLVFMTTRYSYYLMLILMLPIFFETETILSIWLGNNVPDFTGIFTKLVLIVGLINSVDNTFLMAYHAIGKIKTGNLFGGTLMILSLPIGYICLKIGMAPPSVFYVLIIVNSIGTIIDFWLIHHYVAFSYGKFLLDVALPMILVTALSVVAPFLISHSFPASIMRFFTNTIIMELIMILVVWYVGVRPEERTNVLAVIKSRITRNKNRLK